MTRVCIDDRQFIVDFDENGAPLRIKERKLLNAGFGVL